MQKILIADVSREWQRLLADALQTDYQIACCTDGNQALQLLERFCPDMLILDLMLPGRDGLSVLQSAISARLLPTTLVTSRFYSDYLIHALEECGVDFIAMKPCTVDAIADRIRQLSRQARPALYQPPDPYDMISRILVELNVPTSHSGFQYLRLCILAKAEDPGLMVTKHLYLEFGKQNRSTKEAVEKAIRTSIETAWKNRNEDAWRRYFPAAPNGQIARPSNNIFISRLADHLAQATRHQTG